MSQLRLFVQRFVTLTFILVRKTLEQIRGLALTKEIRVNEIKTQSIIQPSLTYLATKVIHPSARKLDGRLSQSSAHLRQKIDQSTV